MEMMYLHYKFTCILHFISHRSFEVYLGSAIFFLDVLSIQSGRGDPYGQRAQRDDRKRRQETERERREQNEREWRRRCGIFFATKER